MRTQVCQFYYSIVEKGRKWLEGGKEKQSDEAQKRKKCYQLQGEN